MDSHSEGSKEQLRTESMVTCVLGDTHKSGGIFKASSYFPSRRREIIRVCQQEGAKTLATSAHMTAVALNV